MNNKNNPNFRPWRPGQSGKLSGRRVGNKNISTIVRELLEQDAGVDMWKISKERYSQKA